MYLSLSLSIYIYIYTCVAWLRERRGAPVSSRILGFRF